MNRTKLARHSPKAYI